MTDSKNLMIFQTDNVLMVSDKTLHSDYYTGMSEGLKIWRASSNVLGIICPPVWDRVNWSTRRASPPPAPRFRQPCNTRELRPDLEFIKWLSSVTFRRVSTSRRFAPYDLCVWLKFGVTSTVSDLFWFYLLFTPKKKEKWSP